MGRGRGAFREERHEQCLQQQTSYNVLYICTSSIHLAKVDHVPVPHHAAVGSVHGITLLYWLDWPIHAIFRPTVSLLHSPRVVHSNEQAHKWCDQEKY